MSTHQKTRFCAGRFQRGGLAAGFAAVFMLLLSGLVQATPLGLTQTYPDFMVGSLSYSFTTDGDGGQLTIVGTPSSFTAVAGGDQDPVFSSAFQLKADIDGSGSILSGSFGLDGVVRDLNDLTSILYDGSTDPDGLLSGSLTAFGFAGSGSTGILEFSYGGIGGLLDSVLGPLGEGGMILSLSSSSLSDFDTQLLSSDWTGSGYGDVFASVPEPAILWLLGAGGLIMVLGKGLRGREWE